jgi:hypothetical protein
MTTGTKAILRMTRLSLLLVVLAAGGCMDIEQPNKPPTASITVQLGGETLSPTPVMGVTAPAYMIMGAGQSVTLRGAGVDMDGEIASYEWWRTDVSRSMRSPAPAMGAAGMAAAGMGGMGAGGMGGMGGGAAPAGGAGGAPAIPPPPFTGDPPKMATVTVELPVVGNYRYSLWVTDDGGLASIPATVTLVVR